MKIAVCEDRAKDRDKLLKQLQAVMKRLEVDADVTMFESAEELLKEAADKTFFSMFFLDILLTGMSGMEAALKLRRLGNYSPVVFTTVSKDYLTQSYGVCASDYLVKPIADKDIESAFSRAIKMLEGKEQMCIRDRVRDADMEYNHLNITLKSIYYFLAVVENKSVTKAAQKLYITQPLLSKKLMALEAETGVRLMEREGRGIRITRAGEYLYAEWKVLIDQYEKSVIHGALIENVPVEHMNVGCFPVLHVSSFLMPYLEQLNDISPDLTVKVKRENYTLLLEDLQEGRLDVAFMMLSDLPMGQECFEWEEVDACTLVCVATKNSPLSGKKNISFEELNGQNIFLGRPEGSPGGISAIH